MTFSLAFLINFECNFSANILALSVGISIGWISPSLPVLQSPRESPLGYQITTIQGSFISSLLPLGALFGTILFGYLAEAIGRFWGLFAAALPQTVTN